MARVEQARKNIKYSTIAYILKITLQFVVRLVFVKSLPIEYLGINGLLSNFLSMLSLAELGVGPAIIYSLYQPLAKKDTATIKALIALFKKSLYCYWSVYYWYWYLPVAMAGLVY